MHRVIDFQPPALAGSPHEVVLHRRGAELKETSIPQGEFSACWVRIADFERVASLEFLPHAGDRGELREGFWLFCGQHFVRVMGPPRGEGLIGGTCCSSLRQLQRHRGCDTVAVELRTRYEAMHGIIVAPGVLRITRQAWHPERRGATLYDCNQGIGGEATVLEEEGIVVFRFPGGEECWRIRDWSFNPFAPEKPKARELAPSSARMDLPLESVEKEQGDKGDTKLSNALGSVEPENREDKLARKRDPKKDVRRDAKRMDRCDERGKMEKGKRKSDMKDVPPGSRARVEDDDHRREEERATVASAGDSKRRRGATSRSPSRDRSRSPLQFPLWQAQQAERKRKQAGEIPRKSKDDDEDEMRKPRDDDEDVGNRRKELLRTEHQRRHEELERHRKEVEEMERQRREEEEVERKRREVELEKRRRQAEEEEARKRKEMERHDLQCREAEERERRRKESEEKERKRKEEDEAEQRRQAEEAERRRNEQRNRAVEEIERRKRAEEMEQRRLHEEAERQRREAEELEQVRQQEKVERQRKEAEEVEQRNRQEEAERQQKEIQDVEQHGRQEDQKRREAEEVQQHHGKEEAEGQRRKVEEFEQRCRPEEEQKRRESEEVGTYHRQEEAEPLPRKVEDMERQPQEASNEQRKGAETLEQHHKREADEQKLGEAEALDQHYQQGVSDHKFEAVQENSQRSKEAEEEAHKSHKEGEQPHQQEEEDQTERKHQGEFETRCTLEEETHAYKGTKEFEKQHQLVEEHQCEGERDAKYQQRQTEELGQGSQDEGKAKPQRWEVEYHEHRHLEFAVEDMHQGVELSKVQIQKQQFEHPRTDENKDKERTHKQPESSRLEERGLEGQKRDAVQLHGQPVEQVEAQAQQRCHEVEQHMVLGRTSEVDREEFGSSHNKSDQQTTKLIQPCGQSSPDGAQHECMLNPVRPPESASTQAENLEQKSQEQVFRSMHKDTENHDEQQKSDAGSNRSKVEKPEEQIRHEETKAECKSKSDQHFQEHDGATELEVEHRRSEAEELQQHSKEEDDGECRSREVDVSTPCRMTEDRDAKHAERHHRKEEEKAELKSNEAEHAGLNREVEAERQYKHAQLVEQCRSEEEGKVERELKEPELAEQHWREEEKVSRGSEETELVEQHSRQQRAEPRHQDLEKLELHRRDDGEAEHTCHQVALAERCRSGEDVGVEREDKEAEKRRFQEEEAERRRHEGEMADKRGKRTEAEMLDQQHKEDDLRHSCREEQAREQQGRGAEIVEVERCFGQVEQAERERDEIGRQKQAEEAEHEAKEAREVARRQREEEEVERRRKEVEEAEMAKRREAAEQVRRRYEAAEAERNRKEAEKLEQMRLKAVEAQRKHEETKERRRREAEEAERLCREAEAANQQRREAEEAARRRREVEEAAEQRRKIAAEVAEAEAAEKKRRIAEAEEAAAEKKRRLAEAEEARRRKDAEDRRHRDRGHEESKRQRIEVQAKGGQQHKEAQGVERLKRREAEEREHKRFLEAERAQGGGDQRPQQAQVVMTASTVHATMGSTTVSQTPRIQVVTAAPAAVQTRQEVSQPTALDLVASFVVQNHIDWAAEAVLLALPEAFRNSMVADGPCAGPDPSEALLDRIQARRAGTAAAPSAAAQSSPCSSGTLQMQPLVAKFFADNPVDTQTQELFARQTSDVQFKVIHQGKLSGPNPSAMLVERITKLVPSVSPPLDAIGDFITRAGLDTSCEKVLRSLEPGLAQQVMAEGPLHGNRLAAALSGRIRRLRNAMGTPQAQTTSYASSMRVAPPVVQCAGHAFGQYVQPGVY